MSKKSVEPRPLGILVVSLLVGIQGFGLLLLAIVIYFANSSAGVGSTLNVGLMALVGLLELACVYALWSMKTWGYWMAIIVEILSLLLGIYLSASEANNSGTSLAFLSFIVLLYLFAGRDIRTLFRP